MLIALYQLGALYYLLRVPATGDIPVWFQIAVGVGWLVACIGVGHALWAKRHSAVSRAIWLIVGFMLYVAARLTLFARSDYDRQRLPFMIVTVGSVLMIFSLARWAMRKREKEYDHK